MDRDATTAPDTTVRHGDGLDPADWSELRALGHRMLDDAIDNMAGLRDRPVWRRMPDELRRELHTPLPRGPEDPAAVYDAVRRLVLPHDGGNTHPRFMGWVQGGGTPVGMLAELLAGAVNANLGGRDHAPIEVERAVIRWTAEMLGFPETANGVLVTGTSAANLVGVVAARTARLGREVRARGIDGTRLRAYASAGAHGCIPRALDMAGLGTDALHLIPVDAAGRVRLDDLAARIEADRAAGSQPFLVVGNAGTVDTGAVDDLAGLAALCQRHGLWFHVDAAYGALGMLAPSLRPVLAGLEQADSVALDFHKWAQVQYDSGCVMVRDGARLIDAFGQDLPYLQHQPRGLAGGHPWPCDLGPDLSRGFRALKVWMTLRTYGADRLGRVVEACCACARHMRDRVEREPALELLAPVGLNIVCFRVRQEAAGGTTDLDRFNRELVADLQEAGIAAPSTTTVGGRLAIRAAIVNHRTRPDDVDAMVDGVLRLAAIRSGSDPVRPPSA